MDRQEVRLKPDTTYARSVAAILIGLMTCVALVDAQQPIPLHETGIKYTRDSEEYATITRQIYRLAADAVTRAVPTVGRQPWTVVLDIDETTLDNSIYQLERAAYGRTFDAASFDAWGLRREAGAVPGVTGFVATVHRAGGHVAWITNRDALLKDATKENLQALGMWADDDRLCVQDTPQRTKGIRRAELIAGKGECAWSGTRMRIVAFVGDQMNDFPAADERIPDTGSDTAFGRTCFLVPNAMYGDWTERVTRVRTAAVR